MALYDIEQFSFTYPKQEKPALTDLNLRIREGEFLVVCGRSGCGKSTLMRQFKTAVSPYGRAEGRILFDGRELSSVSVREQAERIGYVYQSPDNQIVTDKVWHELAFGLENLGFDQNVIRLRVAEMASFFGIQNWFMKNVDELSGGQKQLLNLASVMAMQPDILLLDEPTSQLDPLAAGDFLATLRKINAELGTTIVLVEHRLEEVLSYADRVLVLENGSIYACDAPAKMGVLLRGNEMAYAMPVPMRIFDALGGSGDAPVTVREGREWIAERLGEGSADRESAKRKEKQDAGEAAKAAVRQGIFAGWKRSAKGEVPILSAKDVWFRYTKDGEDIVRDLNLSIRSGELYCLLGGNGTGKTTTLSLLGRLLTPVRGKVLLKGTDISSYGKELREGIIGILPQNPQTLFVKDTVYDDLMEMIEKHPVRKMLSEAFHGVFGKRGDKAVSAQEQASASSEGGVNGAAESVMGPEERIAHVAEIMEISHLLSAHPYDLSGGEQQRAALAKVLLKEPEILMLDEPTKGMDGFYKRKLAEILRKLTGEGKTVVMVSHDIEFCAEYADTCAMFFNGNVVASAPAKQFFKGNSFYTTVANRMAGKWFPDAVTANDVAEAVRAW